MAASPRTGRVQDVWFKSQGQMFEIGEIVRYSPGRKQFMAVLVGDLMGEFQRRAALYLVVDTKPESFAVSRLDSWVPADVLTDNDTPKSRHIALPKPNPRLSQARIQAIRLPKDEDEEIWLSPGGQMFEPGEIIRYLRSRGEFLVVMVGELMAEEAKGTPLYLVTEAREDAFAITRMSSTRPEPETVRVEEHIAGTF